MRRYILTFMLLGCSVNSLAIGTGVIVHDKEFSLKAERQWNKEATQWKKEAEHWQSELTAYNNELLAKTGIRDVQRLVQDANVLSNELMDIYDEGNAFIGDYINNPESSLSSKALNLIKEYHVDETCTAKGFVGEAQKGCEAKFMADLATYQYSKELKTEIDKAYKDMKGLTDQIKNAQDIKASQDAANAIETQKLKMDAIKFEYQMIKDRNESQAKYIDELNKASFKKKQLDAPLPNFGDKPFTEIK